MTPSFLKVGQLARRTGLTVRTLHHYDQIALLSPSLRTPAGARSYGAADLERLHRILAMKQLGYGLSDIQRILDDPRTDAKAVLLRQIETLEAQIRRAGKLTKSLRLLLAQIDEGALTSPRDWLDALELMALHQKHLSEDELHTLRHPPEIPAARIERKWVKLIAEVHAAMLAGLASDTPKAKALAWRWIHAVIAMTDNRPELAIKLRRMQLSEPRAQALVGITPQMFDWIGQAMALARVALFAKYLTPLQTRQLKDRQLKGMAEDMDDWLRLAAIAQNLIAAGVQAHASPASDLARQWVALGRETHHQGDADMQKRIQTALANQPDLRLGVGMTPEVLDFVRQAIATLPPMPIQR